MKRLLISLVMVLATFSVGIAFAPMAAAGTNNGGNGGAGGNGSIQTTLPPSTQILQTCSADTVTVTSQNHFVTNYSSNNNTTHVTIHGNAQTLGISNGSVTGDPYAFGSTYQFSNNVSAGQTFTMKFTGSLTDLATGQVSWYLVTGHFTVNANGTVTADFATDTGGC